MEARECVGVIFASFLFEPNFALEFKKWSGDGFDGLDQEFF